MKEMMNKRIAAIATLFASIVLLLFAAVLCMGVQTDSASAEDGDINSRYIFTLVTDEDGSDTYGLFRFPFFLRRDDSQRQQRRGQMTQNKNRSAKPLLSGRFLF